MNHVRNSRVRRNERRAQAITRAAQRDLRTADSQLERLAARPGNSAKETAKLEAQS